MTEFIIDGLAVYLYGIFFLFFPGWLIKLSFREFAVRERIGPRGWTEELVANFLLSVVITGVTSALCSIAGVGLHEVKNIFVIFGTVGLVIVCWCKLKKRGIYRVRQQAGPSELPVLVVIGLVFIVMVYQGGLLDFLADGWWHLAYIDQITRDDSLFISQHPIAGGPVLPIIYPPLWHLQVALISGASGVSPPIVWHFFAALSVALLLSAFFGFVLELTGSRNIALLAVVFHIFLIGGLTSYFRVAPWPGNVSYIGLYYFLALTFRMASSVAQMERIKTKSARMLAEASWETLGLLVVTSLVIVGLHGVGAALLILAVFAYLLSTLFFYSGKESLTLIHAERRVCTIILAVATFAGFLLAITVFRDRYIFLLGSPPAYAPFMSLIIPCGFLVYLGCYPLIRCAWGQKHEPWVKAVYFSILFLMLYFLIDFRHLIELFVPNSELIGRHVPRDFQDSLGNWLFLPFWEHQLRGGLLFSGIVSLGLGLILVFLEKNRATVFIFAMSSLVLLVLFSPYFFTLGAFLIPLPSVYRVSLLLFSPLVLAVAFSMLLSGRNR